MSKTDAYLNELKKRGIGRDKSATGRSATAAPVAEAGDSDASAGGAAKPAKGPGWVVSFCLCLGLLVVLRWGVALADSDVAAMAMIGGAIGVVLFSRVLRRAFLQTALVVLVVSAVGVGFKHGGLPGGPGGGAKAFARQTIRAAFGWGPGKQLAAVVNWRRKHHADIIEKYQKSQAEGRLSLDRVYSPYFNKISGRDPQIRAKALELTRPCPDNDAACEVAVLNRFVTEEIRYRSDPRGNADYVQEATFTLQTGAGDCEDQSILLASLLEAVGERTLLAFSPGHAYPVVCFSEPLIAISQAAVRRSAQPGYRDLVWSQSGMPTQGQAVQGLIVDNDHCYPLEPTQSGSYIGKPHSDAIDALVDPVRGGLRGFAWER